MATELGRRIRQLRLDLGAARGDPVTLADFGRLVAKHEGRDKPYTPATVSGWEQGLNEPALSTLKAIAAAGGFSKEDTTDFVFGKPEPKLRETPIKRVSGASERKRKGA